MKALVIVQTANGFFLQKHPDFETLPEGLVDFKTLIPAVNFTKPYGDYSGKSVLEIVEKFFTEPPAEKT